MTTTETTATAHQMTNEQATDEAVLRLIRKLGRLHPAAFADVMKQLPEGAREQLGAAERRADVLRDRHGVANLTFPAVFPSDDDLTED